MSISRRATWLVPVVAAAAVGGLVLFSNQADAIPPLPPLSAQQLADNVASATPTAFSGQVEVTTNIGLPDLSGVTNLFGMQDPSLISLLAGTTTIKVAADPAVGGRAEIDSATSAYVAVTNAASRDGWIYSSGTNSATHLVAPASLPAGHEGKPADPAGTPPTPQSVAQQALDALTPSTTLTVLDNVMVAGRAAYTLQLTPNDAGSLVTSVDIAVDASTWLPLKAQIWATSLPTTPSLSVAFTSISYATPDAALFAFTPPSGTTVKTVDLGAMVPSHEAGQPADQADPMDPADPAESSDASRPAATVVAGQGWASVVQVTNLPAEVSAALADPAQLGSLLAGGGAPAEPTRGHHDHGGASSAASLSQLLGAVAQPTPQGTMYSTYLFSLLVTPSGHVYAGAVPASAVAAAASAHE